MNRYKADEVCTLKEWLALYGVGDLPVGEYDAVQLVVKGDGKPKKLAVNKTGHFWHFADGPLLFTTTVVMESSNSPVRLGYGQPLVTPEKSYFPTRLGFGVAVQKDEDGMKLVVLGLI